MDSKDEVYKIDVLGKWIPGCHGYLATLMMTNDCERLATERRLSEPARSQKEEERRRKPKKKWTERAELEKNRRICLWSRRVSRQISTQRLGAWSQ